MAGQVLALKTGLQKLTGMVRTEMPEDPGGMMGFNINGYQMTGADLSDYEGKTVTVLGYPSGDEFKVASVVSGDKATKQPPPSKSMGAMVDEEIEERVQPLPPPHEMGYSWNAARSIWINQGGEVATPMEVPEWNQFIGRSNMPVVRRRMMGDVAPVETPSITGTIKSLVASIPWWAIVLLIGMAIYTIIKNKKMMGGFKFNPRKEEEELEEEEE